MPLWLIPLVYTVRSVTAGLILPRLEHIYLAAYTMTRPSALRSRSFRQSNPA